MAQLCALPEPGPGGKPRARGAAGGKGGGKGELTLREGMWGDPDWCCVLSFAFNPSKNKREADVRFN